MDDPVITIGGREFEVPKLSLGQIKIVVPTLIRLNSMNPAAPTEENIEDLTTIAYLAILRGNPTFPKSEFLNLPATYDELCIARPIIGEQAGMTFRPGEVAPGEAPAV